VEWKRLAPVLANDTDAVDRTVQALRETLGTQAVVELESPSMGSEDFAWYAPHVPLVHLRIGGRPSDRPATQLHQTNYFCDEQAIATGALAMASAAAALCQG